jgi:hypothetical protein
MQEATQSFDSLVMVVRDSSGNVKPVFQENRLFQFLITNRIVSPAFPKIPYLLGHWQDHKEITQWE